MATKKATEATEAAEAEQETAAQTGTKKPPKPFHLGGGVCC